MTLGSLFDGIGGFPLAASLCGITPVWASEIEPFCVAVTRRRFPEMKHLGDITKIDGGKIPPVDIITFGSPCQDLSVAGNRAGLAGERSGLFHEAVRIIYEMRRATYGAAPTYVVWENVPGAFSSNSGRDFQAVLAEITKADIPMPRSGRWANAGVVRGNRITFAWRVLDAQYWGVPQRRKRIFAVGSFGSGRAEEILFKPDGLPGNTSQGTAAREEAAGDFACGAGSCYCYDARGNGGGDITPTITGDHANRVNDYMPLLVINDQGGDFIDVEKKEISPTLRAKNKGNGPIVTYSAGFSYKNSAKARGIGFERELAPTLRAGQVSAAVYAIGNGQADLEHITRWTVRRLTPLECERLQGYPDGWTDIGLWTDEGGKLHKESSDTARYRALGNSLALPCALRVIRGITEV